MRWTAPGFAPSAFKLPWATYYMTRYWKAASPAIVQSKILGPRRFTLHPSDPLPLIDMIESQIRARYQVPTWAAESGMRALQNLKHKQNIPNAILRISSSVSLTFHRDIF